MTCNDHDAWNVDEHV